MDRIKTVDDVICLAMNHPIGNATS